MSRINRQYIAYTVYGFFSRDTNTNRPKQRQSKSFRSGPRGSQNQNAGSNTADIINTVYCICRSQGFLCLLCCVVCQKETTATIDRWLPL